MNELLTTDCGGEDSERSDSKSSLMDMVVMRDALDLNQSIL